MKRQRSTRWRAALAVGLALTLLAAACADDDDETATEGDGGGSEGTVDPAELEGETVTIFGPEVEGELQGLQDTFDAFTEETGITVEVSGDRSFETQLGNQIDGGNPPDIAMIPQPGRIQELAGDLVPLPDDVVETLESDFDPVWTDLVTAEGDVLAIPAKADLKSLVWYSPAAFEEGGYEIPETQEDFIDLAAQMAEDGETPFCLGLGSDDATGWPGTDWIEDYMLRLQGPDVYDEWFNHDIPFDDPQVLEVGEYVYDLWSTEGYVYGGLEAVASTPFAQAGLPLLEGNCQMYRMGNFYAANWPEGTELGPEGQVDAFFLPGSEDDPNITLSGGIYATAFSDEPAVMETMRFIASTGYSDARAPVGGFLSPNRETDTSQYPTELEQNFGEILVNADPVRFDASDLMPAAVGSGSFWSAMVDITSGQATVEEAFTAVEESWPAGE
jgi:alpha-glucoside transport system substrate-binding protein